MCLCSQLEATKNIEKARVRQEFVKASQSLAEMLKAARHNGSYFDRTEKELKRLCTPEGWFTCQVGQQDNRGVDTSSELNEQDKHDSPAPGPTPSTHPARQMSSPRSLLLFLFSAASSGIIWPGCLSVSPLHQPVQQPGEQNHLQHVESRPQVWHIKKNQILPIWGSVELPGLRLFKMFPLFSSLSLGLKRRGRSSLLWWKLCRITSGPTSTWTTSTACSSPGTTWSWSTSCATRKGHTSCSVTASRSSDGQLAQAQQNWRLLGRRSACCERLWGRSDLFNVNDFWQLPLLQWPDRSIYFKLSCYSAYCSILFVWHHFVDQEVHGNKPCKQHLLFLALWHRMHGLNAMTV